MATDKVEDKKGENEDGNLECYEMETLIDEDQQDKTRMKRRMKCEKFKEGVFQAVAQRDKSKLDGVLHDLLENQVRLSSELFRDKDGRTVLMKALLHLKNDKNDTIEEVLHIAENTGDLQELINTSCKTNKYKGQTALHIAIEKRSLKHVKLLVQKGADVQAALATGEFFQRKTGMAFYFGELPLSLAACTNQPDIVSFLIEKDSGWDQRDSKGNTVLHALVVVADNNTDMFAKMYDRILTQLNKLDRERTVKLEATENFEDLTPLKLAAKLGKIKLLKHILHREFKDEDMKHLNRRQKEWEYGHVQATLYDMTSIDTNEHNSVLDILVLGGDMPNRAEMLQLEPLRSIIQDKWDRFASKLFLMNFVVYVAYLSIFTTVAYYRKEGQPPFPIETPLDYLRTVGEIITVLGAIWCLAIKLKMATKFRRLTVRSLFTDDICDLLFFYNLLHPLTLLLAAIFYICGLREYVGVMALSLTLAWINLLYYSQGSQRMGIYSLMIQKMLLGDLLNFILVYCVLLFGFSAAVVTLMRNSSTPYEELNNNNNNGTLAPYVPNDFSYTLMDMFKLTIGMGELPWKEDDQYRGYYYFLLIYYLVLTYILLLNMLIALMGNTISRISDENQNIWRLQRAYRILEMECFLPKCLRMKLYAKLSGLTSSEEFDNRKFLRVEEMNWETWRSDGDIIAEVEPDESHVMKPQTHEIEIPGRTTAAN